MILRPFWRVSSDSAAADPLASTIGKDRPGAVVRRHDANLNYREFEEDMNYQLVLQVNGESLADFDAMVNLEQELSVELKDFAEGDGHDMGCGEINIFIIASNPVAAFEKAKPVLERHGLLAEVKSAFRSLSEDEYTTIWPENSTEEFSVA